MCVLDVLYVLNVMYVWRSVTPGGDVMSWLSGPCRDGEDEPFTLDGEDEVERRIDLWRTYDEMIEGIEEAARWPNRQPD